jgi:steroid 5-alpha reductase family enzyme|tara:strand:+ start:264 stop:1163 length:900 start_codon:yes stop_codon:yes gene_type:complete
MSSKNFKHIRLITFFTLIIFLLSLITPNAEVVVLNLNLLQVIFLYIWVVQIFAFIPAFLYQTEKYYDFIGSITYSTSACIVYFSIPVKTQTDSVLLILILLWASRLGLFLFSRILNDGNDKRFDKPKQSFFNFLQYWIGQAMWISFTAVALFVSMISPEGPKLTFISILGIILWFIGFIIEVISDNQKRKFKRNPDNNGQYITTGLWSRSRHPNYFGEIVIWFGIAIISFESLNGLSYIALISPFFVYLLLTKGSGIPLLENNANKKWGNDPDYNKYKKNTPVLFPKLFDNVSSADNNS